MDGYTLRYVPDTVGVLVAGHFYPNTAVTGVTTHPPGTFKNMIRADWTAVEIRTELGKSRWYGVQHPSQAFIDSSLRFVMACNDRDEVLSKWELYKGDNS